MLRRVTLNYILKKIFVQHRYWDHVARSRQCFFTSPVAYTASGVHGWPWVFAIPVKLVSQIVAGKFVEQNELLSVNIVSTESEPQLLYNGRLVLTSTPKRPKQHIEDTSSWLEAFSVHSLILLSQFPQWRRDLLQYQLLILRTHHQFAGRLWLAYDQAFCKNAVATNLTDWSAINVPLFNFHATGASVHPDRELSDESTEPHGASSSHIICKSWNKAVVLLLLLHAILPTNAPAALVCTALELALVSHQASPKLHPNDKLTLLLLAQAASPGAKRLKY